MIRTGQEVRGLAAFNKPALRMYQFTVSSGVNTKTALSDDGASLATWSSGAAVLSFPKCRRAAVLSCTLSHTADTTAGNVHLVYPAVAVDAPAGTVGLNTLSGDATPSTAENPADTDIVTILMLLDEGAS